MVGIVTNAGLGLDTSSETVFAAVGQQGGVVGNQTFSKAGGLHRDRSQSGSSGLNRER